MKKTGKIFFIFFLLTQVAYSQKMNLQKFSVKEGLIQSTVKHIQKGGHGGLWLGTNNGLSRFNGKTFENFTTSNGLPSNDITALLFADKALYIGTRKGFCSFNGNKIEILPIYKNITGTVVKLLEKNNILHVLTTKGYYRLNILGTSPIIDSVAIPNIIAQQIRDAEFDEDGNLWIATSQKGLYLMELNICTKIPKFILIQNATSSTSINKKLIRIVNFNTSNLLKGNSISSIEFDNRHNLIISDSDNGIAEIKFDYINNNGIQANYIQFSSTVSDFHARTVNIYKDTEGNIYLATDGFNIIKIPIDKNTGENVYNEAFIIPSRNSLCFAEDNFQNLWIGTLNDGLICMSTSSSLSFNKSTGLGEEKVVSVFVSGDSAIWVGTYGGGAFRYKHNEFKSCFWPQGITESIIKSITEDNQQNIWLGTIGGGIDIINKNDFQKELKVSKVLKERDGLTSNYVSYLYKDSKGAIWAGYLSSSKIDRIVSVNGEYKITSFTISDLAKFNVTCITDDNEGNIWVTSNEGVWSLNPKTGHVDNQFAVFKNIQTIAKDWNGNMWLGSSDIGVIILKNKLKARYFEQNATNAIEKINAENGISSNYINTILFDKEFAWLITNNGINQLKIDYYLNNIKEIKSFHKGQNFASYDNKPNTSVFDKSQVLWIGSIEGLTQYKNFSMTNHENKQQPQLFITSLLIENKKIDWTDADLFTSGEYSGISFKGFYNWHKIPNNLVLDYKHSSLQFNLSTDNIANQQSMNYTYKLIGYDKDWSSLFGSNEITYRNLPAGDYSLIIKTSASNDFSEKKEYVYSFSIVPPFWKTKWFYILISIILIVSLYVFIVNREKRLKREKMRLELLIKARTSEIEAQKREIELQNSLIQGINKDLTDSIKYAQRIQQTILPDSSVLEKHFADYCVMYKPRNIVSGDYYWFAEQNDLVYVAVVDCTGHGVPGAFMSLISSSILTESVKEHISQHDPVKMLEYLRQEMSAKLNQHNKGTVTDGLDIALICFNKQTKQLEYVNANRPLYIISNDELITLTSENITIGGEGDINTVIPTKKMTLKTGDLLFMFTDGITDQFGGERNKKYNPARLRQFLLMHNHLSLTQLESGLTTEITEWQGKSEQTDDILLIGLKIA